MAEGTPLTDEQRARVLELDSKGHAASHIARVLWEEFGLRKTRNAVIGVLNRSGARQKRPPRAPAPVLARGRKLPSAVNADGCRIPLQISEKPKQSRVSNNHIGGRALRPAPVAAPIASEAVTPANSVGLMEARFGQCRAVVGRGSDALALFCGAPVKTGSSWCPACRGRFIRKLSPADADA